MNMLVKFSPELSAWIAHNLDRGCAAPDLVRAMLAQDFDPAVATALVNAVVHARSSGLPPPEGEMEIEVEEPAFHYETPRLPAGSRLRAFDRDVVVALRLQQPALALLDDVLSADECARFVALGRDRLRAAALAQARAGGAAAAAQRGPECMLFRPAETPFVAAIERRLAALMNCALRNGEGLQLLNYHPGAETAPHYDFLTPGNAADDAALARSGQRVSSLVIYLNDVERGGETLFPELGLAVTPRQGRAVHFEYTNSHGDVDLKSVHAAAPVLAGEKWVLTKWMREREFVAA